jgi:hypothetical protein
MEASEVLKIVANGLASQGGPAMSGATCLYRTPEGRKCAAGWIITDEEIAAGVLNMNLDILKREGQLPKSCEEHFSLLASLQNAHDNCALSEGSWKWENVNDSKGIITRLKEVAENHGLDPWIVTEAFKNYS